MTTIDRGWSPPVVAGRSGLATAVRAAGWTMLGLGVLVAGFLVYELFVTSFFAGRAQAGLAADLDRRIGTASVETAVYDRGSLDLIAVPIPMPAGVVPPSADEVRAAVQASAGYASLQASAVAGASLPQEAPAGSLVIEPAAPPGDALGRIEIASIGLDWTVVEGVSRADLRSGAGHMPDTALPGQPGNAVISGHRTTYGAPFHRLAETRAGDLVTVTTAGGSHVYQIVDKRVVMPNETWVTGQWEGSWLTLTTCHPKFSAQERLVVFARLVGGPNAATLAGGV